MARLGLFKSGRRNGQCGDEYDEAHNGYTSIRELKAVADEVVAWQWRIDCELQLRGQLEVSGRMSHDTAVRRVNPLHDYEVVGWTGE